MDNWVNDELHSLTGFSDRAIAQFMVAIAKKVHTMRGSQRIEEANYRQPPPMTFW